jgi:hypothetical protein
MKANGSTLTITARGTVDLKVTCENGEEITVTVCNVMYSNYPPYELLSVG